MGTVGSAPGPCHTGKRAQWIIVWTLLTCIDHAVAKKIELTFFPLGFKMLLSSNFQGMSEPNVTLSRDNGTALPTVSYETILISRMLKLKQGNTKLAFTFS